MAKLFDCTDSSDGFTEDDTFRVLSRPDIHKMVMMHTIWKRSFRDEGKPFDSRENISYVKYHGWNWIEFLIAKKAAGYSHY